jgi:hypothetical protein
LPGRAVCGGGARTVGEKLFAPPGVMAFSVGVGETDVVVVVVLEGLGDSLPLHAVSVPMAMIAPPPAISATRRAMRSDFIVVSYLSAVCPMQKLRTLVVETVTSI